MATSSVTTSNKFSDDFGAEQSVSDHIDVQHYLRILRKYKWPITVFSTLATLLTAFYAFTVTPVYQGTSVLLIESQRSDVVSVQDFIGAETQDLEYYETQFELLRSRSLATKVVDKLGLWDSPELSSIGAVSQTKQKTALNNLLDSAKDLVQTDLVQTDLVQTDLVQTDKVLDDSTGENAQSSAVAYKLADETKRSSEVMSATENVGVTGVTGTEVEGLAVGSLKESLTDKQKHQIVAAFSDRLTVSPVRKTKLVKIHYESIDPEVAADVANEIGNQYIKAYLDQRMELTASASAWLSERLAVLKQDLDAKEDNLLQFKRDNGLIDVNGSVGRLNEQELLMATTELVQARSDLSDATNLYNEIQSLKGNPEFLASITAVASDSLVQGVKVEQGAAQRNLDELLNRYGERHPRVVDAKSQLATLERTLDKHVNRVVASFDKNYSLLRQRVRSIEAKLASGKQEIAAIGAKKFDLDALEREVITSRELYNTFYTRMTEARSTDGLQAANATISEFALAPRSPIKPRKELMIAIAAIASLMLSAMLALLYEQMDDTVKAVSDVEDKLGLRMLGIVPLLKGAKAARGKKRVPLNPLEITDKNGTFAESINTARTAIILGLEEGKDKVILVTSSVPAEGKSSFSINLAYSMAKLERVLLIDCDLRRPSIANTLGLDKETPGLSSLLTRTVPAANCIQRNVFDCGLDVLTAGTATSQPLEMLSSDRFASMLGQLREIYDRIIIDCAPCQAVSDALVLSKQADAVVYAVKSHQTSIELVKRGVQRLNQVDAPLAGILMTQVDVEKLASYGGDHYYQGYYDYYGYNDNNRGKLKSLRGHSDGTHGQMEADMLSLDGNVDFEFEATSAQGQMNGNGRSRVRRNRVKPAIEVDNELELTTRFDVEASLDDDVLQVSKSRRSNRPRFDDDLDIL